MIPLFMIRHGKTRWNAEKRLQGQTDVELSLEGIDGVKKWLLPNDVKNYRALSSPMKRARQTAELLKLDVIIEPRITEMSWGAWEGQHFPDIRERLGDRWPSYQAMGLDFRPDDGESPRDVQTRLKPWLAEITVPTVAVSHKGVLQALHALATGWDMIGKPPLEFKDDCGHLFMLEEGRIQLSDMNIPLVSS